MVGPERAQFVLFGSSIVQLSFGNGGWGASLADLYARKDAATQPSLVIVYFGGNDSMRPHPSGLGPHVPLPEYIENMRKIAKYLKSLSDCTRVIFLSAPPINEEKIRESLSDKFQDLGRTNDACRVYSEACLKLCREMNIKAVDLWTAIQKRDDWATACFTDGIHFSSEASEIVVEEILRVLKEADWEPSLYWESMPAEFGEDSPYYPVGPDGKTTVNLSDSNLLMSNPVVNTQKRLRLK
ncbi:hypothetical protein EUGRSUZ_B02812 [Eucalyptus grandis]|uniref:Uncharacterized protein n=2 Tax=Eucalyptus grandis TaxID=71139 RepID=A0ACC3M1S7_EUCGR|nr:hypothetical protein EUGRSUZ_B02812 [Eucalyptus grandis]